VGRGVFLNGQPRPYSKGAGPIPPRFGFPSIYAHTLSLRTTKFDVVTYTGRGLVFRDSATPSLQGVAGGIPALPNFGGSFLFMHTPFVAELPNLIPGGGLFLGIQPRPHHKGWRVGSQRSPILGVPFYLCIHPLSQNYQI